MKRTVSLLATLCLMQGAHAQTITSAVPGFISYQGRALDANGVAIGTSGGALAPVNRTVTFRVWDHPSNVLAANLIYSEQQTVTISGGEFSVLIGQGTATSGTTFGYSESSKGIPDVKIGDLGVFGGSTRYLGVTIEDGTAAVDNEISPRQQLVSSAYSFRSKYAEQLGANGLAALTALDSGNVGIGNTNPPARFTVTGANTGTSSANPQLLVTDSADPTKRLRIGVDSNGTGSAGTSTGFIQSFKEGTGGGAQNLLLNPNGGGVGIGGAASSNIALSVAGAITATGAITGGSISTAGAITGGSITTAAGSLTTNTGNIGIGTTAPVNRLEIMDGTAAGSYGSVLISRPLNGHKGSHLAFMRSGATVMGLGYEQGTNVFGFGNGTGEAFIPGFLAIDQNTGKVGIGTVQPANLLQVQAPIAAQTATSTVTSANAVAAIGASDTALHFGTYGETNGWGNWIQSKRTWDAASFSIALNPNGGNVGIGKSNPTFPLDVAGSARVTGQIHVTSNFVMSHGAVLYGYNSAGADKPVFWPRAADNGTYLNIGTGGFFIRDEDNNVKMRMYAAEGLVQFGTTSTTSGQLNVGTRLASYRRLGGVSTDGGSATDADRVNSSVSIWADGVVVTNLVDIHSDARIKNVLRPTDSVKDLQTLMAIQITDYQLKDTIANGNAPQKKVIAQQVEQIFPQAVSVRQGIVPDIYKNAQVKDHWVMLATDLKVGERVRLISASGESVEEVLEVRGDAFRSSLKSTVEEIFVYGREVPDFRSVDYDAIAMLNVSATQQLKHEKDAEMQVLRDENAALRRELATKERELAAKDESVEARLIALERRMSGEGVPVTVSLKTASAAK